MSDGQALSLKGYQLRDQIGKGGFGAVYRAYQLAVAREVAIKVILPEHANQPDFIRRFEVEAQTIARLESPHVVPLYDYWRDPAGAYLVMRSLRSSLAQSLKNGPWTAEAAARLLDQVASALTVAHRAGVIHRDIKPDNILLDEDDNAYLADFGIAKDTALASTSREGVAIGSPAYMTPEQIKGEAVTPRRTSTVWGSCCTRRWSIRSRLAWMAAWMNSLASSYMRCCRWSTSSDLACLRP